MKDFFSPKQLGLSLILYVATGFIIYSVARSLIDIPAGPGSLGAGIALLFMMLIVFLISFPVVRYFAGKHLLNEESSRAWSYAFWNIILFSAIVVAGSYAYGALDDYWQQTYSERAAEEIVYEATIRQDESHCDNTPSTQEKFRNACHAVFANNLQTCEEAMTEDECRQNVILANVVTPQCESEQDKGCGFAADKAIWARAIRDNDSDMCRQIASDDFRNRCQTTLKETEQLYSGTIKECTQTAKKIGSESGSFYECVVGTAMYQNNPDRCSEATKENIYPRLKEGYQEYDYINRDQFYKDLQDNCRQQLNKEIDIEYGEGYTAASKARDFYNIQERVEGIFFSVVFGV